MQSRSDDASLYRQVLCRLNHVPLLNIENWSRDWAFKGFCLLVSKIGWSILLENRGNFPVINGLSRTSFVGWLLGFYSITTFKVISRRVSICDSVQSCWLNSATLWGGELAQLVRARGMWPCGLWVWIPVLAITFSCTAIHFPAVYNLQHHQTALPLIPGLYGVGG